jgi:hypothetical protein
MSEPNSNDVALGLAFGGAISIAVGSLLVMDDVHDFGEIISYGRLLPWEPLTEGIPHLHHGLLGLVLLILGVFLFAFGMALLMKTFILKAQEG